MAARQKADKPTALDLFSGCGGLSLGLRQAGFAVVAAVDSDPLAASTYRMNHKATVLLERDIAKVNPRSLMESLGLKAGELGLLAGCPPCQGFSTLRTLNGRKEIDEPLNDLIFQFVRFARVFRPKTIMMENVPRLAQDVRLAKFVKRLGRMGYQCRYDVLDAADFGIPQRRRRMILLASLSGPPEFARPVSKRGEVRSAIGTLPRPGLSGDPAHDYPVERAPHVLALIRKVPKDGGSRHSLGWASQLLCHLKCDGFSDVYGRMSWSAPSPTITGGCINPSKGRFLHPEQNRAITLREAALLQGFPRRYRLDLSRGRYPTAQMIGNAFPPAFAARHARVLRAIAARLDPGP
jgi:DNA (cytosine-5)-methyltransferase 1